MLFYPNIFALISWCRHKTTRK